MPATTSPIFTTDCRGSVHSPNYGGDLIVVHRSFPKGTEVEMILEGRVPADRVDLAADGKPWAAGWHVGETTGEPVYVERHVLDGRGLHGWVDPTSRRLVQVG